MIQTVGKVSVDSENVDIPTLRVLNDRLLFSNMSGWLSFTELTVRSVTQTGLIETNRPLIDC